MELSDGASPQQQDVLDGASPQDPGRLNYADRLPRGLRAAGSRT